MQLGVFTSQLGGISGQLGYATWPFATGGPVIPTEPGNSGPYRTLIVGRQRRAFVEPLEKPLIEPLRSRTTIRAKRP